MLNHTKQIRKMYESIQRKIFYMIPEKWDQMYLYSSVIDTKDGNQTGELFFYYVPKGIFKKKPVNVYEIPSKFNIDEKEYLDLVQILYEEIKLLRQEFIETNPNDDIWTNITISIKDMKFKIEFSYEDLINSYYTSYDRHVIWRYKYLGIGDDQVSKEEREILKKYRLGVKSLYRTEEYSEGIYIQDIQNIIDYQTIGDENSENNEQIEEIKEQKIEPKKKEPKVKNQLILSEEEIRRIERRN